MKRTDDIENKVRSLSLGKSDRLFIYTDEIGMIYEDDYEEVSA